MSQTDVVIVGAGVAGLGVATALKESGISFRLLEASPRVGGVIQSLPSAGGIIELGPQTLRASTHDLDQRLQHLNLIDTIVEPSPQARKKFILNGDRLQPFPACLLNPKFLPTHGLLRLLAEPLIKANPYPEESVASFCERRFGRLVTDRVIDPLIAGIVSGDIETLEAQALFPKLTDLEQAKRSVLLEAIRGRGRDVSRSTTTLPKIFTFQGGVESLVLALASSLQDKLTVNCAVEKIDLDGDSPRVFTSTGEVVSTKKVVVAATADAASKFIPELAPLLDIPMAPVISVHLGWRRGLGPQQPGMGFLVPTLASPHLLGGLFVSAAFSHLSPDYELIRVMMGGSRAPNLAQRSDLELVELAKATIETVLGGVEPTFSHCHRALPGLPQYTTGHTRKIKGLQSHHKDLSFVGWSYTGMGVTRSLDQGVETGRRVALQLDPAI